MNEQERKAPIYFLVDTSESMHGEPITRVKNGIDMCIQAVRNDQQSSKKSHVSIITFATEAKVVMKLTKVTEIASIPDFEVGGQTNYAAAIKLLNESLENDLRENTETEKGDYKAVVVLFSDGKPDIGDHTTELDKLDRRKINYFIAATTNTDEECKKALADVVQHEENVIYLPETISGKEGYVNTKEDLIVGKPHDVSSVNIEDLPPLPSFSEDDVLI